MKKITQTGFTLLELMVVIAMMGVLMAVGIPSFQSMLTTNEMADTTNELILSLRKARAAAISSGRNTIVCSSTDGSTCSGAAGNWNSGWLVMVDRNVDGKYLVADDELLWVHRLKSNTTITITPSPTTATAGINNDFTHTVTFSYTGELNDGTPGEFFVCSGVAGTSGYPRREISVSVGGEASLFKKHNSSDELLMKRFKKNQGFTLIEVMVALFILTVGMLGSTAMMLRSQQQAEETSVETTVAQRAWNIAELLRASVSNVSSASGEALIYPLTISPGGAEPACISAQPAGCTGASMIDLTSFLISRELGTFLPEESPQASISQIAGDAKDPVLKVDISWNKIIADGSEATQTYTLIFQP